VKWDEKGGKAPYFWILSVIRKSFSVLNVECHALSYRPRAPRSPPGRSPIDADAAKLACRRRLAKRTQIIIQRIILISISAWVREVKSP